ncbi:MAG: hypothetical protein ACI90V_007742 [Bacillariaceae sp.]
MFRSFTKAEGFLESRIVILADGYEELPSTNELIVGDNDKNNIENIKHGKCYSETAENYRIHLKRLREAVRDQTPPFVPISGGSIELIELETRHGSAPAIQTAMSDIVSTPLVMICQHDNFFINETPLREVVYAMQEEHGLGIGAKCIHFLSTATLDYKNKVKRRYQLDLGEPLTVKNLDCPLVPLVFWYGRSHITYSDYVRSHCLNRHLAKGSHLEELLGEKQLHDILSRGMVAHKEYGTYVLDQGKKEVLYHVSGRRAQQASTNDSSRSTNDIHTTVQDHQSSLVGTTVQHAALEGSFTTARSCRAIVPGLTFPVEQEENRETNNVTSAHRKPFKQRCFHCGEKGHSKKFCPKKEELDNPSAAKIEIIDLS